MFKLCIKTVLFVSTLLLTVLAVPKPDEADTDLGHNPLEVDSHKDKHFDHGEHNMQYDHEAFLGEDVAKTFDQLEPEESKRRLALIVDRIDENKDGFIDTAELKAWIQYTQRRYIDEDVERLWRQYNANNNETIAWETYRTHVYGFLDNLTKEELEQDENGMSYVSILKRDRRRWAVADKDLDDSLTRAEFTAFLHPEDHPDMRDVVLDETLEDIDKDKDGKVSIEEYIGDIYRTSDPESEEPEWVVSERETFAKFRDFNGDGFLDREEVRAWIVPKEFDSAESEAKHLVFEADSDNDQKLTKEEILDKYDVFVGSQATDFGEALVRHDEF